MKRDHESSATWTAAFVVLALAGCSVSASLGSPPPPACSTDANVRCSQGTGWSCTSGDNPRQQSSGLSCSEPTANGSNDDFCCFEWTYGSTCTPDDQLTPQCHAGSFGYRCQAGTAPSSLDETLTCGTPTPDGAFDDFCCT